MTAWFVVGCWCSWMLCVSVVCACLHRVRAAKRLVTVDWVRRSAADGVVANAEEFAPHLSAAESRVVH